MSITCGVALSNGVYGAAIAGFLSSLLGGTKIQISAPSLAALTLALNIVNGRGARDLSLTTMVAGAVLWFLAVTGLGTAVKFIPQAVVTGITTGLAMLIVRGLLPTRIELKSGITVSGSLSAVAVFSMISLPAVLVSSVTLVLTVLCAKLPRFFPAGLLTTAIVSVSGPFREIPSGVPGLLGRLEYLPKIAPLGSRFLYRLWVKEWRVA